MKEHLYTIPVNEAFDRCGPRCPYCMLREKLEHDEIGLILGASMMEPEIRIKTNEKGFCRSHFAQMQSVGNKLPLALMLESHLESLKKELRAGGVFSRDIGGKSVARVEKLSGTCYVCERIDEKLSKMIETSAYLFDEEKDFREKFKNASRVCLPHYRALVLAASKALSRDGYNALVKTANEGVCNYLDSLKDDISLFCKKFDYRSDDIPWGNSKDSIERSVRFLKGE